MARYSPELILQTISIFESRTDKAISLENARQAVENICGFFQVLQEWDEADSGEKIAVSTVDDPTNVGGKRG